MAAQVSTVPRHGLVPDRPVTTTSGKRDGDPREAASAAPGLSQAGPGAARSFRFPNRSNFTDLTGRRFHGWTVLDFAGTPRSRSKWRCRCQCGVVREVGAYHLLSDTSKSCGCTSGQTREVTVMSQSQRIDVLLAVAAAAELYVRKCGTCRGIGELREPYECMPVLDGTAVRKLVIGGATLRSPCPECGPLRRAIAYAQGLSP